MKLRCGTDLTILDGSMGVELAERGFATFDGLWSANALVHHPHEVKRLHLDYLKAGAEVIGTNTYATIPSYLDKANMGHRVRELASLAVQLAREALSDSTPSNGSRKLAGCLPPLSESYRPDMVPPYHEARPVYRELIECMVGQVDVFVAETMSSVDEAVHVAQALAEGRDSTNHPLLVAFTLHESQEAVLRSGESVGDAIRSVARFQPAAILFNCSTPEALLSGIEAAKNVAGCPIGVYPNRFEPVPEGYTLDNEKIILRDDGLDVKTFVAWSKRFIEAGATMVGGCCGIGPRYIEGLTLELDRELAAEPQRSA